MDPQATLEKIAQLDEQTHASQEQADRLLKELQEGIRAGEASLGDPIADFCLVSCGLRKVGLEERLKEIQQQVQDHQGEQVLAVKETYRKEGHDGCFSHSFFTLRDKFLRLGILQGELSFDFSGYVSFEPGRNNLLLPTHRYAQWGSEQNPRRGWESKEGKIALADHQLVDPARLPVYHSDPSETKRRHLLIGDREVELYFRIDPFMREPNDFLNILPDEEKRKLYFESNQFIDTRYVPALDLLGIEAPSAFRLKYDQESEKRKVELFREIQELAQQGETEALKKKLEYAVQVGLPHSNVKISGEEPGMKIHLGDYIQGKCDQYQIEIPEQKRQS